jgi:hypothetical protein
VRGWEREWHCKICKQPHSRVCCVDCPNCIPTYGEWQPPRHPIAYERYCAGPTSTNYHIQIMPQVDSSLAHWELAQLTAWASRVVMLLWGRTRSGVAPP